MTKNVEIRNDVIPTLQEYKFLCSSVGWNDVINFDSAETSLRNSVYSVIAMDHQKVIGMGRIIGDGAIYFYIQDIIVHPDYQEYGIGKEIMNALMGYIDEHAPDKAFVGLFASEGKSGFYEKYKFKDYSPHMTGMFKVKSK